MNMNESTRFVSRPSVLSTMPRAPQHAQLRVGRLDCLPQMTKAKAVRKISNAGPLNTALYCIDGLPSHAHFPSITKVQSKALRAGVSGICLQS